MDRPQLTPCVSPPDKYYIKLDALESDLTTELPTWILSAYAPGREAPDQLFGGPAREQSFEEMRLHHMKGKAEGNEEKVVRNRPDRFLPSIESQRKLTRAPPAC